MRDVVFYIPGALLTCGALWAYDPRLMVLFCGIGCMGIGAGIDFFRRQSGE